MAGVSDKSGGGEIGCESPNDHERNVETGSYDSTHDKICPGYKFDGSDITKNLGGSFGQEISIYVTITECS